MRFISELLFPKFSLTARPRDCDGSPDILFFNRPAELTRRALL
jgi:hypothetical protein